MRNMLLASVSALFLGQSLCAQDSSAIYVMTPDGTEVRKLATPPSFKRAGHVRWSRDGKQLAFHAWEGQPGARQVFVVNADGTGLRSVGPDGQFADWSPDNKQLAFRNDTGILVQNLDGESRTFLVAGTSPRWSPDGSQMALLAENKLIVRDLVAETERELLDASWEQVQPGFDWSPDGRRLAVVAAHNGKRGLWIIDVTKPEAEPVLRLAGKPMGQIAWSPDGKQLAITLDSVIQLLSVAGEEPARRIPNQIANSRDPAWSPDGKSIAFSSNRP